MVLNRKAARKLLEEHGWTMTRGGKHVVKMTKPGRAANHAPAPQEPRLSARTDQRYPPSSAAQVTTRLRRSPEAMEYTALIHHEDGTYWAEVPELPGVFASGDSVDELLAGLKEAVALYLGDGETGTTELSELKLAVTA